MDEQQENTAIEAVEEYLNKVRMAYRGRNFGFSTSVRVADDRIIGAIAIRGGTKAVENSSILNYYPGKLFLVAVTENGLLRKSKELSPRLSSPRNAEFGESVEITEEYIVVTGKNAPDGTPGIKYVYTLDLSNGIGDNTKLQVKEELAIVPTQDRLGVLQNSFHGEFDSDMEECIALFISDTILLSSVLR